jgi:nitrous oxidase accessory protein
VSRHSRTRRARMWHTVAVLAPLVLLAAPGPAGAAYPRAQDWVDAAAPGDTVRLPPGRYAGPVVIDKAISLVGDGDTIIDSQGSGSVIRMLTDGASVSGFVLTGSGENHDHLDACVQVRGDANKILDNILEDCLFGVDLQQSNRNIVRNNRISSKDLDLGLRGDAIRLWYSRDNEITDNTITDVRDMVVWYSANNLIARNSVTGSRYALHFMYSKENRVEENRYTDNMVGVFLMYSDGVEIIGNQIRECVGATAMGIGFKESSNVLVERNTIINCAKGIYLDISPYEPDTTNRFIENRIGYNGVGVVFHSDWHGNVFRGNDFRGNFSQVTVRGGGSATRQSWSDNYWDDYAGFDRDADGVGDTPFELYAYADRLWVDLPPVAFFRGSLLFEAIDFLERLAPFTSPTLILRDEAPRFEGADEVSN